ncbi:MAG: glycosyltransferase family A protein [Anaerolineales bacterium]
MPRVGMNPARHRTSSYRPAPVTVAVLVYLPHLSGYFEHRLEVVKLCLESLLLHTDPPYDLLVFDNGSCEEAQAYLRRLQRAGQVEYLLTSNENLGKLGALRLIAGAAPGDVIAYADDDTFFYPGWLPAHRKILNSFPNVGMVSGSPERSLFDHAIASGLRLAEADPEVQLARGQWIPETWEREWAVALGKEPAAYLQRVRDIEEVTLERRGARAYATACHNQFLSPKDVLARVLSGAWPERLMGGLNDLDNAIDAAGHLRLTTLERTTKLIGNVIGPELAEEAARLGIRVDLAGRGVSRRRRRGIGERLARWRPVRWFLQGLYNRLFALLAGQTGGWQGGAGGEERADG